MFPVKQCMALLKKSIVPVSQCKVLVKKSKVLVKQSRRPLVWHSTTPRLQPISSPCLQAHTITLPSLLLYPAPPLLFSLPHLPPPQPHIPTGRGTALCWSPPSATAWVPAALPCPLPLPSPALWATPPHHPSSRSEPSFPPQPLRRGGWCDTAAVSRQFSQLRRSWRRKGRGG